MITYSLAKKQWIIGKILKNIISEQKFDLLCHLKVKKIHTDIPIFFTWKCRCFHKLKAVVHKQGQFDHRRSAMSFYIKKICNSCELNIPLWVSESLKDTLIIEKWNF